MLMLPPDFREFIALLNSNDVRYVIVGGYAVAYHGYPRATGDIDLFVDRSEENAARIEAALNAFGFSGLGLRAADFLQPDTVVQLGYPPNRIDLVTSVSGIAFSDAWEGRETVESEGILLLFIGREALLSNKAASGRPKDLADLDALT